MTIPITKRVKEATSGDCGCGCNGKGNCFPINQEVTKNADGTGGPIDGVVIIIAGETKKNK